MYPGCALAGSQGKEIRESTVKKEGKLREREDT